jgi:peptidoglycan/xylan/chitin deacetylase (PgdA/CDA1 family)
MSKGTTWLVAILFVAGCGNDGGKTSDPADMVTDTTADAYDNRITGDTNLLDGPRTGENKDEPDVMEILPDVISDVEPDEHTDGFPEDESGDVTQECKPDEYYASEELCYLCAADAMGPDGEGESIDDDNLCTDDDCSPHGGVTHMFNTALCDDGDAATGNDKCLAGECVGTPIVCTPGQFVPDNGVCFACNDNGTGYTDAGTVLDDGDSCTDDVCAPTGGVKHYFNEGPCDDGDSETISDVCTDGTCAGIPVICTPETWFADGNKCLFCDSDGTGTTGESLSIYDLNSCTDDLCDADIGVTHTANQLICNDGDPGTVNDLCTDGECIGQPVTCTPGQYFQAGDFCLQCNLDGTGPTGPEVPLNDNNSCTDDVCEPGSGIVYAFNSDNCNDGNPETIDDVCELGLCIGTPLACPAGDYYAVGTTCLLCNSDGTGPVDAGQPVDDSNVCTDDVCNPGLGVQHYFNGSACDDGNQETIYDYCEDGECSGTPITCAAGDWFEADKKCLLCNGDGTGTTQSGGLINDGNPCTDDLCDPGLGVVHEFNGGPCNDGNPGTIYDTCVEGSCVGTATTCPAGDYFGSDGLCFLCNGDGTGTIGTGSAITDGNACTDDVCSAGLGVKHYPNGDPCDDSDPDTVNDMCIVDQCIGTPLACPAGDHYPVGGSCFLCNGAGTGSVGEPAPIDDGNVCTTDLCDPGDGVVHYHNGKACNDGNPETIYDYCVAGDCIGTTVTCEAGDWFAAEGQCYLCNGDGTGTVDEGKPINDGNLCTEDFCDPGNGVINEPIWKICDDGDPDTVYDHCENGVCLGTPVACPTGDYFAVESLCYLCNGSGTGTTGDAVPISDSNLCTDDFCNSGLGVVHYANGVQCDDGDPNTQWDWCDETGVCAGIPILCPAGDYYAEDGLCYLCKGDGSGPVGAGLVIDDGNECTDDLCDPGDSVLHWNNFKPCDDGDAETVTDYCQDGACVGLETICPPGKWINDGIWWCVLCNEDGTDYANDGFPTDDEEDCTDDICDPEAGVVHIPIGGKCWDENICTTDDTCIDGLCTGTPIDCYDGSDCTVDSCDPVLGCSYQNQDVPCDDGIAITPDDTCINGVCVGMLDPDGDGIINYGSNLPPCKGPGLLSGCIDNCPLRANPGQQDSDNDGLGNACETARWWCRIDTTEKVVALTFDDGWSSDAYNTILKTLDEKNAMASFFLVGGMVDDGIISPFDLIKGRNAGHTFGNHTYNHDPGQSLAVTISEILLAADFWTTIFGDSLRPVYRQPYAEILPWINIALEQTNYTESILGNFDSSDWLEPEPDPQLMAQCILDQIAPGDIIGFHVGPDVTVQALPFIIDGLRAKGYEMLTIEQMIAFGPPVIIEMPEVKTCYFLFTGEDW